MISSRKGTRLVTTVLVMVVSIAMLTWAVGTTASDSARGTTALATSFAGPHTIVVYPNGHDDTADIQAAFNTCVSYGPGCTVQLVKGTYYTAQITVIGFQGNFVGMGQELTTIQALNNLPAPAATYNTPSSPFWAGLPGPSNPWPDLFTFVNGAFGISGMTITEPYANPIVSPGWYLPTEVGDGAFTALYAAVLITSQTGQQAYATIDHVTVIGAAGDLTPFPFTGPSPSTFNIELGIAYEGMFLPTGWNDPYADQIPVSGTFSLTNSVLSYSEDAVWVENTLDASATICFNSISSSPEPGFVDLSNSQLLFCGNSVTNVAYYTGLFGGQSYFKTDLLPSTVYVTDNYFGTNWEGAGPALFDYGAEFYGIASTLSAVVTGNVVVSDTSCGCYVWQDLEMISASLVSAVFSGNVVVDGGAGIVVNDVYPAPNTGPVVISGNTVVGADIGIDVHYANGNHVTGNVVKNSPMYGIIVWGGSSDNVVSYNVVKGSGLYDLYWDGTGTGNVWTHNICSTSSPPGLC